MNKQRHLGLLTYCGVLKSELDPVKGRRQDPVARGGWAPTAGPCDDLRLKLFHFKISSPLWPLKVRSRQNSREVGSVLFTHSKKDAFQVGGER